jgi:hypothetical protein
MIDIQALSTELSTRTGHDFKVWRQALDQMVTNPELSTMTDGEFYSIVKALSQPHDVANLLRWLTNKEGERELPANVVQLRPSPKESTLDFFFRLVNQSKFELAEWLKALDQLEAGLKGKTGALPRFTDLMNSIHSTIAKSTTAARSPQTLDEMVVGIISAARAVK